MEISLVRKRVQSAMVAARERAQRLRAHTAEAERAYSIFLDEIATPIAKQVASALKAEGHACTVFTPSGGLRLASDRARDDYVEFLLDVTPDGARVIGRVSRSRGSRTLTEERPVKGNVPPNALTEEDVLAFLVAAIEPWLER